VEVHLGKCHVPIEPIRLCLYTDNDNVLQAVSLITRPGSTRIDVATSAKTEARFNAPPHQSLNRWVAFRSICGWMLMKENKHE